MKILKYISFVLFFIGCQIAFISCDEKGDPQGPVDLNDEQSSSVSMRGKWGQASGPVLPFGTTEGVLDELIMDFRIGDDYYPTDFSAIGADYFFATDGEGTWDWDNDELTLIALTNVAPIVSIQVIKEGSEIRVTFIYEGDGGGRISGLGEYSVTLKKIAP